MKTKDECTVIHDDRVTITTIPGILTNRSKSERKGGIIMIISRPTSKKWSLTVFVAESQGVGFECELPEKVANSLSFAFSKKHPLMPKKWPKEKETSSLIQKKKTKTDTK